MAGQLVYLVGPSGSGKDSILRELAPALPADYVIMKRVITRPSSPETEDFESLSLEAFNQQEVQGEFALSWRANGLAYGVRTELDQHLVAGKTVLVNGSRGHWTNVVARYPSAILVLIKVDDALLRERLISRGRESIQDIQRRLERNAYVEQALKNKSSLLQSSMWVLDNSDELHVAVNRLRQQLSGLSMQSAES